MKNNNNELINKIKNYEESIKIKDKKITENEKKIIDLTKQLVQLEEEIKTQTTEFETERESIRTETRKSISYDISNTGNFMIKQYLEKLKNFSDELYKFCTKKEKNEKKKDKLNISSIEE